MALDFTLLTEEQIWGDNNGNGQLDVMKRYGTKVAPTDLAVLLGSYMTGGDDRTSEGDLTCASWSASSFWNGGVRCVCSEGGEDWNDALKREVSARPALPPSEASKISPSEARVLSSGIRVAEYGEYPQTVADERTSAKLERLHDSRSLRPTGKNYTFDSAGSEDYKTSFKVLLYPEYEMDGKRYIRVLGCPADSDSKLSTGEQVEEGQPYWVQVQPIEWLVDESGWMVSKKCLFTGIQFDTERRYDGDFSKTFMKKYLDTYFAKEMGHEEIVAQQKRGKVLTGLSARLEEMTNTETIDVIKEKLRVAERGRKTPTDPKRMEEAARIKQVRQARDVILKTLQEAQAAGDEKLIQEIINMDIVRYYDSRHQIQQEKVQQRRATRRAQRKQGGRG